MISKSMYLPCMQGIKPDIIRVMTIQATESSLTQHAYDRIRADLLAWKVGPGARLKINELCERHGINLSAVREALSRLCAEGLVISLPQRGFRVAPISVAELIDLTMTRIEIEQICIRRAVANTGIEWETKLVATGHQLFRTPKADEAGYVSAEWFQAHQEFHRALVAGCGSQWLMRLHDQLYLQAERYQRMSVKMPGGTRRDIDAEHRALMEALLARDADQACALISAHLNETAQLVASSSTWPQQDRAEKQFG
jgi:DNA-binding GntR family transcriptional regulator